MNSMHNTLALILAGGRGTRLDPLTRDRAKPAVPFGGGYRIIDFALSNCINSGLRKILLLTQYKSASLDRHINLGWRFLPHELDEYIHILPPQQRISENWYLGTADAVYQNIYSIESCGTEYVLILAGDHIYKMDYQDLINRHVAAGADCTVACLPVPLAEGREFGIMRIDESSRVIGFDEKPQDPKPMPGDPSRCLASMGVYVFNTSFLFEILCRDATDPNSRRDFGRNILPSIIHGADVLGYPFIEKKTGETAYWRDVGTLDALYEANMDLVSVEPELNLYDKVWPIRTLPPQQPPPKFVFSQTSASPPRLGHAMDSMVCNGSIISGGSVSRSVLGYGVRVNSWSSVEDSMLFDGVQVGRHARVRRAIIDKGNTIPEGFEIGFDHEADRRRGFVVTESGVVVVARAQLNH
jgi:glucose-1-phosphate adenylyltransferase